MFVIGRYADQIRSSLQHSGCGQSRRTSRYRAQLATGEVRDMVSEPQTYVGIYRLWQYPVHRRTTNDERRIGSRRLRSNSGLASHGGRIPDLMPVHSGRRIHTLEHRDSDVLRSYAFKLFSGLRTSTVMARLCDFDGFDFETLHCTGPPRRTLVMIVIL